MQDPRIPVYVVTGFLGAGKTTLLRRALKDPRLSGSLLLVNEVAELGVDDRLMRLDGTEAVLLANGCLCCAASEGLSQTLQKIVESEAAPAISRVIVETTGLADPLPVISTIAIHPFLSARLRVEMVVTIVDSMHAVESEGSADYARQIQSADVVLLSKTDLATPAQVDATTGVVRRHNPLCAVHRVCDADFADLVTCMSSEHRADRLATGLFSTILDGAAPAERTRLRIGQRFAPSSVHTSSVQTFCLELGDDLDWLRLSVWLSLMLHRHGANVLRIKGFLALENRDAPVVVNCVRHVIYFPEHLDAWPDGDRRSFLVFIVKDLMPDAVLRSFLACVRRPASIGLSTSRTAVPAIA
ncbi:CobW family GTP-binding protein [Variovorax sp. VNK109]|uniref:CobW family GTP-binding protein n=1 Tax=Variovorax sp. VNK109 TaxID=3400919 RepID=UPI003C05C091